MPLLRNPLNISFWKICQRLWSRLVFTLRQTLMVDPVAQALCLSYQPTYFLLNSIAHLLELSPQVILPQLSAVARVTQLIIGSMPSYFLYCFNKNLKVLKATKQNKLIDGAKIAASKMQFQIDILLIDSNCINCMTFYRERKMQLY